MPPSLRTLRRGTLLARGAGWLWAARRRPLRVPRAPIACLPRSVPCMRLCRVRRRRGRASCRGGGGERGACVDWPAQAVVAMAEKSTSDARGAGRESRRGSRHLRGWRRSMHLPTQPASARATHVGSTGSPARPRPRACALPAPVQARRARRGAPKAAAVHERENSMSILYMCSLFSIDYIKPYGGPCRIQTRVV